MNKLYEKSEVTFAIIWIVVYVVLLSAADNISEAIGIYKLITVIVCLIISTILFLWIKKNHLLTKYGLCK